MLVFLRLLKDEDLRVRRAALLMLNSTAHHQPRLIQDHLAKNGPIFSVLLETVGLKLERVWHESGLEPPDDDIQN